MKRDTIKKTNTTSSNIDYSKWDHFGDDDDDDDSNNSDDYQQQPQVTKFDTPQRVTIGPSSSPSSVPNSTITIDSSTSTGRNTDTDTTSTTTTTVSTTTKSSSASASASSLASSSTITTDDCTNGSTIPPKWIEKGETTEFPIFNVTSNNNSSSDDSTTTATVECDTTSTTLQQKQQQPPPTMIPCYWCQDRSTVTIRIPYDTVIQSLQKQQQQQQQQQDKDTNTSTTNTNTNGSPKLNVSVSNLIPYVDRFVAVGQTTMNQVLTIYDTTTTTTITTSKKSSTILSPTTTSKTLSSSLSTTKQYGINVTLYHSVYLPVDDDTVDWSIETLATSTIKYITIIVYKATPMYGLITWWKKPFIECTTEISITNFHSTVTNSNTTNTNLDTITNASSTTSTASTSSSSFQLAWNQAHEQFLANRQNTNTNTNINTATTTTTTNTNTNRKS